VPAFLRACLRSTWFLWFVKKSCWPLHPLQPSSFTFRILLTSSMRSWATGCSKWCNPTGCGGAASN